MNGSPRGKRSSPLMTKQQALRVLAAMSGGLAFGSAAAAHTLWHSGHRRLSTMSLFSGAALESLLLTSLLIPNFPLTGRVFSRGNRAGSSVALSFDDGPRPPFTGQILDVLREEAVPATFFVLGENARRFPDLVNRMEIEGHRVANHGMDHAILMWSGAGEAKEQVLGADARLREAGVMDPALLFRAPHGWLSPAAHRAVSGLGYRVTGWTKGVWDTASPGVDKIVSRTDEVLAPGSILLLHDGWQGEAAEDRSQTVAALPAIISTARARGLRFVTIEDMIREAEAAA